MSWPNFFNWIMDAFTLAWYSLYHSKNEATKTYGYVKIQLHSVLSSSLGRGRWSDLLRRRFKQERGLSVLFEWEVGWTSEPVWTLWRKRTVAPSVAVTSPTELFWLPLSYVTLTATARHLCHSYFPSCRCSIQGHGTRVRLSSTFPTTIAHLHSWFCSISYSRVWPQCQ